MDVIEYNRNRRICFFSDAHLGGHDRETEARKKKMLKEFFSYLADSGTDALFIVGDLWDFGFEYRHVVPKELMWSLVEIHLLVRRGVAVHFIGGNHDFWLDDFLRRQTDMTFHKEAVDVLLGGRRYFVHHGDGISPDDQGYRYLRKFLRNGLLVGLYRSIHPDIGIPFAKWLAGLGKGEKELDPGFPALEKVAETKIKNEGYDGVIFGHRHFPKRETIGSGELIILGDWIRWFSYTMFDRGQLIQESWPEKRGAATAP